MKHHTGRTRPFRRTARSATPLTSSRRASSWMTQHTGGARHVARFGTSRGCRRLRFDADGSHVARMASPAAGHDPSQAALAERLGCMSGVWYCAPLTGEQIAAGAVGMIRRLFTSSTRRAVDNGICLFAHELLHASRTAARERGGRHWRWTRTPSFSRRPPSASCRI